MPFVLTNYQISDALLSSSGSSQVRLHFAPRSGEACSDAQPCTVAAATTKDSMKSTCVYAKCPASFTYFNFQAFVTISQGVSSFTVEIVDGDTSASVIQDNGGNGFPWSDTLQPQLDLSHLDYPFPGNPSVINLTLHLVVAVSLTPLSSAVVQSKLKSLVFTLLGPRRGTVHQRQRHLL
jgi:hypothetical protein